MSEIARSGKWNPGGGRWLEVIPAFGIATFSRLSVGGAPIIALKSGFDWTRIYCTPGTIGYKEAAERVDNGNTYQYDIKGFSPDDSLAKRQALEHLFSFERVLVRFCDNSGLLRVAGSPVEFLTFAYELGTDTDVPGQRGYALRFTGLTTQPAAYDA